MLFKTIMEYNYYDSSKPLYNYNHYVIDILAVSNFLYNHYVINYHSTPLFMTIT